MAPKRTIAVVPEANWPPYIPESRFFSTEEAHAPGNRRNRLSNRHLRVHKAKNRPRNGQLTPNKQGNETPKRMTHPHAPPIRVLFFF
jgi:hypothetical protein